MEDGPSVNSSDREERIEARRARIRARIDAMNAEGEDPKALARKRADRERKEFVKGKQQIMESNHRLDRLKTAGIEHVTSVRVNADNRENRRRIAEEERRQERRHKLLTEAENSAKRNAAIAMKWNAVIAKEIPQELLAEMTAQREACKRVIDSKEKLRKEFLHELKFKDDEYVKALKTQSEDIHELLHRMSIQFIELRQKYEEELEEIETTFSHEREELRAANTAEIDALNEKRQRNERDYMEKLQERAEEHAKDLEQLKTQDSEDYNIVKINLQTEVQSLQQQLREMKATYLLNTQKLMYNYRVLTTRDDENTTLLAQHKKKIVKLKEQLSNLQAKYNKEDRRYRHANKELTDDYRRITEQYKELQNKFRHFQSADKRKFEEVWQMNRDIVVELAQKALTADKVVHAQQLGWEWFPPAEAALALTSSSDPTLGTDLDQGAPGVDDATRAAPTVSGLGLAATSSDDPATRAMLDLLVNEGTFLVAESVRTAMAKNAGMSHEEQRLMQIDSIFKALSVSSEEDVARLYNFLKAGVDQATGCDVMVHPNDCMARLTRFVHEQQSLGRTVARTKAASAAMAATVEAEERGRREQMAWWERMKGVISPKTLRVYKALLKAMQRYNHELQARAGLITDTDSLRSQNTELKALLHQYLNSQVNQELHIPPTQVMRFG